MSFNQLPGEILEAIFTNLDGASFCAIQRVCKSWFTVLKLMQNEKKLWRKICIKEIPDGVFEEMFYCKSIPLQDPIIDWKIIYRRWYQAKLISSKNNSQKNVPAFCSNPVTCIGISGSWIITGHSNGFLCTWNQLTGRLCHQFPCHLKTVTAFVLVDLLNLGSYYGSEEEPWSHHHIITVSKDTCIKVKSLLEPLPSSQSDIILNKHGDAISSIRIFGNHFVASSRDNTVSLWKIKVHKTPYLRLEILLLRLIIGPRDLLWNLGFWYQKIYCISQSERLNLYDFLKDEWREQANVRKCLPSIQKRVVFTSYFTFRDQVSVILTAGGEMIISIDEKHHKVYYLMPSLQTLIYSVLLKGPILALGGENGRLYLFHVPNNKSLLDINLSKPAFQSTLSEASIVSIDIQYDYNSPTIVASTTETLFILKWHRHKSLQKKS